MTSVSDDYVLYYQTKILISFLCKQRLNLKFLIQLSKILSIELTETRVVNKSSLVE